MDDDTSGSYGERLLLWVIGPLVSVAVLFFAVQDIGPAWSAHLGEGRPGVFTSVEMVCTEDDSCQWRGDFLSDDGAVHRPDVGLMWDAPMEGPGVTIRAQDVGSRVLVYPEGEGGSDWLVLTIMLAIPVLFVIYAGCYLLRRRSRRRRVAMGLPAVPDPRTRFGGATEPGWRFGGPKWTGRTATWLRPRVPDLPADVPNGLALAMMALAAAIWLLWAIPVAVQFVVVRVIVDPLRRLFSSAVREAPWRQEAVYLSPPTLADGEWLRGERVVVLSSPSRSAARSLRAGLVGQLRVEEDVESVTVRMLLEQTGSTVVDDWAHAFAEPTGLRRFWPRKRPERQQVHRGPMDPLVEKSI